MERIIIALGLVLASIAWPAPPTAMYEETELAYYLFENYYGVDLRFVQINWQDECFTSTGDQVAGFYYHDGSDRNCVDRDYGLDVLIHELAHAYEFHFVPEWKRQAICEGQWNDHSVPWSERCSEQFAVQVTEVLKRHAAALAASGEGLATPQGAHASSGASPQAATLAGPYKGLRLAVNPFGVSLASLGDSRAQPLF